MVKLGSSPRKRKPLTKKQIDSRLDVLDTKTLKTTTTPRKKALAKHRSIQLIGTLGFGKMASDVESGKATAAKTLKFISNQRGLDDRRRRIATLGARAAEQEGI